MLFSSSTAARLLRQPNLKVVLPQSTRWIITFYLVDCGSCIGAATNLKVAAALHEPQCTRWNVLHLDDCGGAAVGVEVLQYKPFYTVPVSLIPTDEAVKV